MSRIYFILHMHTMQRKYFAHLVWISKQVGNIFVPVYGFNIKILRANFGFQQKAGMFMGLLNPLMEIRFFH